MRHWSCGISSGAAFILEIHFIHKSCIFVIYTNSLILWWNSSFSVNEPFKRSDNVAGFTLKCTWMWSRRTSTRKNLRPQISQVYFLSPWVNRCLFMLLLQENTCARTHRNTLQWRCRWTMKWCHEPTRADGLPCCKWDRVTAPSCTWSLLLHWPPAPLSSCALVLCVWILGLV